MKVSICITVLNEEKSIGSLLDSLLIQSKKADEIVIVDGGSTDKTIEIIKHYQKKNGSIKLLIEKGGIAHGRNTAIEIAKYPIIAQIDAGCTAEKEWLEKLVRPFELSHPPGVHSATLRESEAGVGVSAGFYTMTANSTLQKVMGVYLGIPPERFDPVSFLPSARSVAFKTQVWEKIGGFNEKLAHGGEDTQFFYSCVKTGIRIARVGEAKVIWEETGNLTFKKFVGKLFNYSKGDAKTGIWYHPVQALASHNIKISFIFLRYMLGFTLLYICFFNRSLFAYLFICLFVYFFWSIWKWRDVIKDWQGKLWLPAVQVSSDIAVMSGFISGLLLK